MSCEGLQHRRLHFASMASPSRSSGRVCRNSWGHNRIAKIVKGIVGLRIVHEHHGLSNVAGEGKGKVARELLGEVSWQEGESDLIEVSRG